MSRSVLQGVVTAVLCRARRHGSVGPEDIREELAQANLPDTLSRDIVELAEPALAYRRGRFHYVPAGASRMRVGLRRDQRNHQEIGKAVRSLLGRQRRLPVKAPSERRAHKRVDFVRPVQLQTEDGRSLRLLTRNISLSGIRLIGAGSLQGKKVTIWFADAAGANQPWGLVVRLLWSSLVGDNLFESGGLFLEKVKGQPRTLRLASAE